MGTKSILKYIEEKPAKRTLNNIIGKTIVGGEINR